MAHPIVCSLSRRGTRRTPRGGHASPHTSKSAPVRPGSFLEDQSSAIDKTKASKIKPVIASVAPHTDYRHFRRGSNEVCLGGIISQYGNQSLDRLPLPCNHMSPTPGSRREVGRGLHTDAEHPSSPTPRDTLARKCSSALTRRVHSPLPVRLLAAHAAGRAQPAGPGVALEAPHPTA